MEAGVFADDIIVWANQEGEVQQRLNAWQEVVAQYGMNFNTNKCAIMVTTRNTERVVADVKIEEEIVKRMDSFKYMGSVIEKVGGIVWISVKEENKPTDTRKVCKTTVEQRHTPEE